LWYLHAILTLPACSELPYSSATYKSRDATRTRLFDGALRKAALASRSGIAWN
jgi:hypothetical protein